MSPSPYPSPPPGSQSPVREGDEDRRAAEAAEESQKGEGVVRGLRACSMSLPASSSAEASSAEAIFLRLLRQFLQFVLDLAHTQHLVWDTEFRGMDGQQSMRS